MGSSLDCEDIKHEYVLVMANYWFGKSTLYKYIYALRRFACQIVSARTCSVSRHFTVAREVATQSFPFPLPSSPVGS